MRKAALVKQSRSALDLVDEGLAGAPQRGPAATFAQNSIISIGRLLISTAVALLLPTFLAHKLSVKTYSAWVLILQMGAYVGYLDFGVQTGISKYVAEFEARNDTKSSSMRASAGLLIMIAASVLGVALTLVLAWHVPDLFIEMPPSLYADVRLSLVFIGLSLSFGLVCSICSAIFLGLQRFGIPMGISLVNRVLYTAVILGAVFLHSRLAVMGLLVAAVNVLTGLLQVVAWRRLASHVQLSLRGIDRDVIKKMLTYCSTLAVWTVGMLCVSGLDVTIVGRYDYAQTAFYSIATMPTNFMISIAGAALGPFLPTASALAVHRTAGQMGEILSKATRYTSILLIVSGIPLLVGGYWVLRLWVGPAYAVHTVGYLRILVLANIVRNTCLPYSSMLIATDSQNVAIAGASAEAIVNVVCSAYLAHHIGAIGVAYGTLLGSFVSVGMHFALSMHFTYSKFSVSRTRLLLVGIVRPVTIAVPSLLLLRSWWSASSPVFGIPTFLLWVVSTGLLVWYVSLNGSERKKLVVLQWRE